MDLSKISKIVAYWNDNETVETIEPSGVKYLKKDVVDSALYHYENNPQIAVIELSYKPN